MTTNISKASANKFQLIFPKLPHLDDFGSLKQFSLNVIDGILPSFSLDVLDLPYKGGNMKIENGFGEFGDWTTTFAIDSSFQSWIVMSDWIFSIANNKAKHGYVDQSYSVDAHYHILDNFNNQVVEIKFENLWPSNLDQVQHSYQDNPGVLTCGVTFSYDRFYRVVSS